MISNNIKQLDNHFKETIATFRLFLADFSLGTFNDSLIGVTNFIFPAFGYINHTVIMKY